MMVSRITGSCFLALALAIPVQAQKDKKPAKKVNEVVEAENALKPGQFTGKVLQASETALQLRVEYVHYELNPQKAGGGAKPNYGGNQQIQQLVRQQQQLAQARQRMMQAKTPQQQYQAMQQMQRQQAQMQQQMAQKALQEQLKALQGNGKGGQGAGLFKEVKDYKDVNIDLDDSVVFRSSFLPSVFDDMGNIKKYNAEEMKELKGDPRLPGYKAAGSDLKAGQKVTVTLAKNKETDLKLRGTMVLITEQSNEPIKDVKKKK